MLKYMFLGMLLAILQSDYLLAEDVARNHEVKLCSFNINFLGMYKERKAYESELISNVIAKCDIIAVQELVATPFEINFSDGTIMPGDPESRIFFNAMKANGYSWVISNEDTGRWEHRTRSNRSVWFVTFYRDDIVQPIESDINGFISYPLHGTKGINCSPEETTENLFDRVPYAQMFANANGNSFVVVNVHLHATSRRCDGSSEKVNESRARRFQEIQNLLNWIDKNNYLSSDIIVVGDFNTDVIEIENIVREIGDSVNVINDECVFTNVNETQCFTNLLMVKNNQSTFRVSKDFETIKLFDEVKNLTSCNYLEEISGQCLEPTWEFYKRFSNHNPIMFTLIDSNIGLD